MHQHLVRRRLAHIDDGQPLVVPSSNLTAWSEAEVLSRGPGASSGDHARPPLCRWGGSWCPNLTAVRRGHSATGGLVAGWLEATGPTDCARASSWAGGSAGLLLLMVGGDEGHSTPASCGAHAPSCWAACSRLTTSSSFSSPARPIMGAGGLGVKSGL